MAVLLAYLSYLPIAALCVARLPLRTALLVVLIGGWWGLPVAVYGAGATGAAFPWWVTGIQLPSDMWLTKAWIPPLVALAGAALRDPRALAAWRPRAIDLPMAGWCVWPLLDRWGAAPDPSPWLASLYVVGSWGLPWLIGRVWFARAEGGLALVRALALSGLANVPVALIEGVRPAMLYGLVYGVHPFRTDGVARYVGYRPIGFLEHGNTYGLWTALTAFAAIWLVRHGERGAGRGWLLLAIVNTLVALASQSAGAIILLGAGLVLLAVWRLPVFVPAVTALAALILVASAAHLSGVVPVQSLARTAAGVRVIGTMRAIGRGSLLWRVSQDTKTLATVAAHPVAGTAQWDWWRRYGTRPWGQALLLVGQYGLVGLLLAWGALVAVCGAAFARLRRAGTRLSDDAALPLAIVVLLALADAMLNAFFFSPAILAAGTIAARPGCDRRATRVARAQRSRSK